MVIVEKFELIKN